MVTKKELLGNELMKEVISIRVDTMWKMLAYRQEGRLPKVDKEGATGEFDNKGALFIPGGFVLQDSDGTPIEIDHHGSISADNFRKKVREGMLYDNAILLYQDGMAHGINLGNGFFAKVASNILSNRQAAGKRKPTLKDDPPSRISTEQITRSYCPVYLTPPYGSRKKVSSTVAVCLIEPRMYFEQCRQTFNLRGDDAKLVWDGIRASTKPILGKNDTLLAPPYMVVCHDTRHQENALTGITRILGFGKFGEFANFTLEIATNELLHELEGGRKQYSDDELFAEYNGERVVGVLRMYPKTTHGKRSPRSHTMLVSPQKDLGLNLEKIAKESKARYNVN